MTDKIDRLGEWAFKSGLGYKWYIIIINTGELLPAG